MKRIIIAIGLLAFSSGCSWLHHGDSNNSESYSGGAITGPDYGPGRGTTGVSSGAATGAGITGSDAAPPR